MNTFTFMDDLTLDESQILAAFKDSQAGQSIMCEEPDYNVFEEHDQVWVIVEDCYYDVEDPQSRRLFSVVDTDPGVDGSGIDFEEV